MYKILRDLQPFPDHITFLKYNKDLLTIDISDYISFSIESLEFSFESMKSTSRSTWSSSGSILTYTPSFFRPGYIDKFQCTKNRILASLAVDIEFSKDDFQ